MGGRPVRALFGVDVVLLVMALVGLATVPAETSTSASAAARRTTSTTSTPSTTEVPTTTTEPPPPPRLWFLTQAVTGNPVPPSVHSIALDGSDERPESTPPVRADQVSPDRTQVVLDDASSSTHSGCGIAGCSTSTVSGGGIIVQKFDGSDPKQLTQGGYDRSPRWSPVEDVIVYVSHRKSATAEYDVIAFIHADGKNVGAIANPTSGLVDTPAFSPDGTKVAYLYGHGNAKGDGMNWELRIFDVTSGAERVLARQHLFQPVWSPDGTQIVAALQGEAPYDPQSIVVVPVDGSTPRTVFTVKRLGINDLRYYCGGSVNDFPVALSPMWSPDGGAIAFLHNTAYRGQFSSVFDVSIVGADGSGLRTVRRGGPIRCDANNFMHYDQLTFLGWRRPKDVPAGQVA